MADSVASFLKLWSGGKSDQAGPRKGFVVVGYSLPAVTRPLIGLIVAPWQLLVLRVADRIGKGIRTSPRDALIAVSTDPQIRGRVYAPGRADQPEQDSCLAPGERLNQPLHAGIVRTKLL